MKMVPTTIAAACLVAAGCTGMVGGGSPGQGTQSGPNGPGATGPGSGSSGGAGSTPPAGTGTTPPAGTGSTDPAAQPVASMHKLTIAEFTNSLHDLLGGNAPDPTALEPDQQVDGFRAV
ncbi:MAG TPA: hypothetical protein VGF76_22795, partial [Polyangiaceae bacterium]